jgi:hypothetical protein
MKLASLLDKFILVLSFVFILSGLLIDTGNTASLLGQPRAIVQGILISIGCSILASSIVSMIIKSYLSENITAKKITEEWGLINIESRSSLNTSINLKIKDMSDGMDILALGMKNFREAQGEILLSKVKKGKQLRILTMDPESPFIATLEKEENVVSGSIKHSIEGLLDWVDEINLDSKNKSVIEVKLYNGTPQDTYQKIDKHVFVGPLLVGKASQLRIAYEFTPGSKGANYYSSYFESLWKNVNFCTERSA